MNIYSKNGDKGTTNLVHTKNVSKSDDRVRLFGDLDELNSYLGLVKTMIDETDTLRMLEGADDLAYDHGWSGRSF